MEIWLVTAYGAIPGETWRASRFATIAKVLSDAGHNVVLWVSNFSHLLKQHRPQTSVDVQIQPGFSLRYISSTGYKNNIGLARLHYELTFGRRFYKRGLRSRRPDLIVTAEPPAVLSYFGSRLSRRFDCPLIIDVIDLWPEQFSLALPKPIQSFSKLLFYPLLSLRRRNLRHAQGLITNSETVRQVCFEQEPTVVKKPSATIATGVDMRDFHQSQHADILNLPANIPPKLDGELWAMYAGTLGYNYDIPTLLEAAQICTRTVPNLKFIIAGAGPLLPQVLSCSAGKRGSNVHYAGHLTHKQVVKLYRFVDIGLCVYGPGSTVAIPDKAYDYMAAGLPIVNSLLGEFASILKTHGCGIQYQAGNADSLAESLFWLSMNERERQSLAAQSSQCASAFDSRIQYGVLPDFVNLVCNASI